MPGLAWLTRPEMLYLASMYRTDTSSRYMPARDDATSRALAACRGHACTVPGPWPGRSRPAGMARLRMRRRLSEMAPRRFVVDYPLARTPTPPPLFPRPTPDPAPC